MAVILVPFKQINNFQIKAMWTTHTRYSVCFPNSYCFTSLSICLCVCFVCPSVIFVIQSVSFDEYLVFFIISLLTTEFAPSFPKITSALTCLSSLSCLEITENTLRHIAQQNLSWKHQWCWTTLTLENVTLRFLYLYESTCVHNE